MKINIIRKCEVVPHNPDGLRCTGRTTGIAYQAIGMAMQIPEVPVSFVDHHNGRGANEGLFYVIADIIKANNLLGLSLDKKNMTVVYNPIIDVTIEELIRAYKA